MDFDETDIQFISASVTNGVDDIRDKVIRFAERSAFGENGRLVILDECDYLTPNAQAALRNIIGKLVMPVEHIIFNFTWAILFIPYIFHFLTP